MSGLYAFQSINAGATRGRGKQKNQKRPKCNQQAAQINPSWLLFRIRSAWPDAASI